MSLCHGTRARLRSLTNPGILRGLGASRSITAIDTPDTSTPLSLGASTATQGVSRSISRALTNKQRSFAELGITSRQPPGPVSSVGIDGPFKASANGLPTRATSLNATSLYPRRARAPSLRLISESGDVVAVGVDDVSCLPYAPPPATRDTDAARPAGSGVLASCLSCSRSLGSLFSASSEEPTGPALRAKPDDPLASSSYELTGALCRPESPLARNRRAGHTARLELQSTSMQHQFSAQLCQGLSPEMVTVYAKRGSRVAVVVDAWNAEKECEALGSSSRASWTRQSADIYRCVSSTLRMGDCVSSTGCRHGVRACSAGG